MAETADDGLRDQVRARYAMAATAVTAGATNSDVLAAESCCGSSGAVELEKTFGAALYSTDEQSELPAEAVAASLGCGNPTAVAELHPGERVLDLGSGGGVDVLLSARRVARTDSLMAST
jgi:arsenite methyltransferase